MFTKILFLYSDIHSGDAAHADAVYTALLQGLTPLTKYYVDMECDEETLVSRFKEASKEIEEEKYVIFAIGEKGMGALNVLNHNQSINMKNAYIGLGIHQYFDMVKDLNLDYIAIPEAAVDTPEKSQIIEAIKKHSLTFAVPTNNPTSEDIKRSYEEWGIGNKPALDKKYIIVMLPGDAPDSEGMRYFTVESADKLVSYIKHSWEQNPEYSIIIHNGPRTGKYDPATGKVVCTHEYKKGEEDPAIARDAISRHFLALLEQNQIPYYFFNFAFEVEGKNRKAGSVFNPLLYIAQADKDNIFIIPGESVSMLGQIPLYVSSYNAIVFKPDSMNSSHEAIFRAAFDKNFVSYFDENGAVVHPHENLKREIDDVHQVASDLIEGYQAEMMRESRIRGEILGIPSIKGE